MTDTTNPETEVETTNPAEAADTGQAEGQDEHKQRARDDKGRFAREGEQADDPDADLLAALDAEDADDELEEIDLGDDKVSVPKSKAQKAREAMLRMQDYTRKTQEVAEQRKAVEEAAKQAQQLQQSLQEDFQERAQLHALGEYLKRYEAPDFWEKAQEEDPIAAQKEFFQWQALKAEFDKRNHELTRKQDERALQTQRDIARRKEEGREKLRRELNWTPEVESSLRAYAKSEGYSNAESFEFEMSPLEAKTLRKAYLYDQLLAKKAQAKPKAPEPKPVKTVSQTSPSNPNQLRDDMHPDEWKRRFLARQARTT